MGKSKHSENVGRNFVARDMATRFKSKRFDGRGNRRANDARANRFVMEEAQEYLHDHEDIHSLYDVAE